MPESIRAAIRYVMTAVFPLPGPAMTSKGPSMWQMAFLWEGVSGILNFELLLFNCYSVKSAASVVKNKFFILMYQPSFCGVCLSIISCCFFNFS